MAIPDTVRWVILLTAPAIACAADARNGAAVLAQQGCQQCHAVRGQGFGHETPQLARDLGERLAPTYGPHTLASALWNHTPAMWTELSSRGAMPPSATESDWRDLFAYLYSLQFFDRTGEAGRGKQVLETKRCTACHSLSNAPSGRGPSVLAWTHMEDPLGLLYQLWNHASSMKNTFARNKIPWAMLTARDLMDLTAYVQNIQTLAPNRQLALPDPESGKPLFDANCGVCHREHNSLAMKLRNKTWMDIGADIWNHTQKMPAVRMAGAADMAKLLAYVWQLQYDGPPGNKVIGEKTFTAKGCDQCHQDFFNAQVTAFSFVSAAWGPTRTVHYRMMERGGAWPSLSPADVANLVAYLNSRSAAAKPR